MRGVATNPEVEVDTSVLEGLPKEYRGSGISGAPNIECVKGAVATLVTRNDNCVQGALSEELIPCCSKSAKKGTPGRGIVINEEAFTVDPNNGWLCFGDNYIFCETVEHLLARRRVQAKRAKDEIEEITKRPKTRGEQIDVEVQEIELRTPPPPHQREEYIESPP